MNIVRNTKKNNGEVKCNDDAFLSPPPKIVIKLESEEEDDDDDDDDEEADENEHNEYYDNDETTTGDETNTNANNTEESLSDSSEAAAAARHRHRRSRGRSGSGGGKYLSIDYVGNNKQGSSASADSDGQPQTFQRRPSIFDMALEEDDEHEESFESETGETANLLKQPLLFDTKAASRKSSVDNAYDNNNNARLSAQVPSTTFQKLLQQQLQKQHEILINNDKREHQSNEDLSDATLVAASNDRQLQNHEHDEDQRYDDDDYNNNNNNDNNNDNENDDENNYSNQDQRITELMKRVNYHNPHHQSSLVPAGQTMPPPPVPEKRVEFRIGNTKIRGGNNKSGPPNQPPRTALPKSALKRFQIDSHSLMSQNVDETEEYELEEKSAVASSTTAPAASNTATTSETKQNHTAQQAPRLSLIESNSSASQEVLAGGDVGEKSSEDQQRQGTLPLAATAPRPQSMRERVQSAEDRAAVAAAAAATTAATGGGGGSRATSWLNFNKLAIASHLVGRKRSFNVSTHPTSPNALLNLDDNDLSRVTSALILTKDNSGFDNERRMFTEQNSEPPNKTPNELTVVDPNNNPITPTGSHKGKKSKFKLSKKVKSSLKNKVSDSNTATHEIFVGLEKLRLIENYSYTTTSESAYEWREVSRWIKYEQTIDPETSIWSKPSIGALVYQSLLYLKTGLQYGTVLLNCDQETFPNIVDKIVHDFVDSGHLNKENRDIMKRTLMSEHRTANSFSVSGLTRKKSTMSEFFPPPIGSRRQSTFTGDVPTHYSSTNNSDNASTSTSRKNSYAQFGGSGGVDSKSSKDKKLSMSEFNLQNKYNSQFSKASTTRENSVKFAAGGPTSENNSIEANLNNGNLYKRRRSTMALLKNTITQSKLNKSDLSIKCIASDAEAFLIYIGVVDFLDRPVMGFIRLQNSQILENVCDPAIKVRFFFILLGPKNESIDYLEIGRCVGTLMTNKEFHECAYRANDRRELIEAITTFTNRSLCLVLPVGEFDDDLMKPLIEWIKMKMKKKLEKQRNDSRLKSADNKFPPSISPGKSRKSICHVNRDRLIDVEAGNGGASGAGGVSGAPGGGPGGVGNGPGITGSSSSGNVASYLKKASMASNVRNDGSVHHQVVDDDQPYSDEDDEYEDDEFNPFRRTGCLFGSLCREIKYRYSKYPSDFKDALNIHCLIAFVFIFTVCIAPALSFGGILADKTKNWFGINEMLIATSLNGVIMGLFSGQPLMIMGPTGPFLIFEEMLYTFCRLACVEFLALRCWVAMWVLIFTLIMLACEGVYVIRYVTRFTEEIFAFLIACVFLSDAVRKIYAIFKNDPIHTTEIYCNSTRLASIMLPSTSSSTSSLPQSVLNSSLLIDSTTSLIDDDACLLYSVEKVPQQHVPQPNIALLSLMLLIGTTVMALSLKKLRRSVFLGAVARRTLSDVGMLISIVLMGFADHIIKRYTGLETAKLDIPVNRTTPTHYRDHWFVSPFGANVGNFAPWIPFVACFPALLIFIVLFFEVELTGMILHARHRKLKKGTGFHLDLLLAALMMNLNSYFGLPWMCAAPVRTLAHWASLSVYTKTYIPGEKPKLIDVKEQRLTNICVHLAIGFCLLARPVLKMIPISVLFGIFLYLGIVSLSGTQLYERIKLFFIPSKYCPNTTYARGVRPSKRNLYTLIQVLFITILLTMKSFNEVSYAFPLVLILLVPLRIYILPKLFSHKELEQLDCADEMTPDNDSALDFYEITHLPI